MLARDSDKPCITARTYQLMHSNFSPLEPKLSVVIEGGLKSSALTVVEVKLVEDGRCYACSHCLEVVIMMKFLYL